MPASGYLAEESNAIASWWTRPLLAVGQDRSLWVGSVAQRGTRRLTRIDIDTAEVATLSLTGREQVDDHNAPAILLRGGRILAAWTDHASRRSVSVASVDALTHEADPDVLVDFPQTCTYVQLLSAGPSFPVMLLTRSATSWLYSMSYDDGRTWSPSRVLIDGTAVGQCYALTAPAAAAGTYWVAFYGHPVSSAYRRVGVALLDLPAETIATPSGALLGDLGDEIGPALAPEDLEVAISPGPEWRVRVLDLAEANGVPLIAYAPWHGSLGAARYKVKRRSSGAGASGTWSTPPWSLAAGEAFGHNPEAHYLGGVAIDPAGGLVTSRQLPTGTWLLQHRPASGSGWSSPVDLYTGPHPVIRPSVAALPGGSLAILAWGLGRYESYTSYYADAMVWQRPRGQAG